MPIQQAAVAEGLQDSLRKDSLTAAIGANSIRLIGVEPEFLQEVLLGVRICEALSVEQLEREIPPDSDAEYQTWRVLKNVVSGCSPAANRLPELKAAAPTIIALLQQLEHGEQLDPASLLHCEEFFRQVAMVMDR